ncbi:hypothetical protein [Clostridium sp.]|uniref:hypothetical protein n=1 Tax=Clostridium sp. TaxID=1506 RepID=UPI003F3FE0F5
MKKFVLGLVLLVIFSLPFKVNAITLATSDAIPHARTYKEGIYKFNRELGSIVQVDVVNPKKPVNIVVVEDSTRELKYYLKLDNNVWSASFKLYDTTVDYTVVVLGDGEVAIRFSN